MVPVITPHTWKQTMAEPQSRLAHAGSSSLHARIDVVCVGAHVGITCKANESRKAIGGAKIECEYGNEGKAIPILRSV